MLLGGFCLQVAMSASVFVVCCCSSPPSATKASGTGDFWSKSLSLKLQDCKLFLKGSYNFLLLLYPCLFHTELPFILHAGSRPVGQTEGRGGSGREEEEEQEQRGQDHPPPHRHPRALPHSGVSPGRQENEWRGNEGFGRSPIQLVDTNLSCY